MLTQAFTQQTLWFSWDGHAYNVCNTQNFLICSIPKIEFFHWSRQCHQYLGPYVISTNKILTTHAPYTYIHVTHLTFCGRALKHILCEIVYEEKKEPQNKSMPIF